VGFGDTISGDWTVVLAIPKIDVHVVLNPETADILDPEAPLDPFSCFQTRTGAARWG
jgi:hypothetical protein